MKAVIKKAKSFSILSKRTLKRTVLWLVGASAIVLLIWFVSTASWPFGGAVTFTSDELSIARRATRNTSAVLEGFLGYGVNGQGWRQYLRFEDLQRQLVDGTPHEHADQAVLEDVIDRLSQQHNGLGMPEFVNLRTALSMYAKMLKVSVSQTTPTDAEHVAAQQRVVR